VSVAWRKAIGDLRSSPARALLVIAALVVGLWAAGGVLVSAVVLRRDLRANFQRTKPTHMIATAESIRPGDLAAVRAMPEVESAELRDFALLRVEVRPDEWIPMWLYGVDDFGATSLAHLRPERGAARPPPGTMAIERDGLRISDLVLGGNAKVRREGETFEVPVSAIVFDAAQAPATQDHFIYAYVDHATFVALSGEAARTRLLVRFRDAREADVASHAESVVRLLRDRAVNVTSTKVPSFERHPHQWQLDMLLALQGAISAIALLLAATIAAQLVNALLSEQRRQIGILGALGATRGQVMGLYLRVIAALGSAAAALGVPLAALSGFAFARFVGGKLNFDVEASAPTWVWLALAALAVVLPVVFSLPALLRATRMTVREAISDAGVTAAAEGRILRWATARASVSTALAIRNGARRPARSLMVLLAMAVGVAVLDTGFNVRASLSRFLDEFRASMGHDVQVVLTRPVPRDRALAAFAGVPNVGSIETWSGGRGELQSMVVGTDDGIGVVALPRTTSLFRPRIVEGRWLAAADVVEAVVNQGARTALGRPSLGDERTLTLGGASLRVRIVGVIEELEKAKVYLAQEDYDAAANPEHLVNSVMIVASDRDPAHVLALKHDVERAIEASNLPELYVMVQAERVRIVLDHLDIVLTVLTVLSATILTVSALAMASATSLGVLERTREIGVLRAIGATPDVVFGLFLSEAWATGVAASILGALLAWPLTRAASVWFGGIMLGPDVSLRAAFSGVGIAVTLATTMLFAWLAARLPARRAVAVSTSEALAYE
jgi:putative ABC transport system permease protein